ncbi:sensor histidine kinase [Luteimonas sp. 50]|uniref:Sensor histidine kinase n=1 Tax=Cognatiluteimonas sedimenti TaxID=2927791 RepID=A0ABT0A2F5_9GAMM|nr:sensor histidine kinase [Lysobacter sedimenti]MCJ0825145.1 sensor histidine kinase [Lysobacter sedimenti]
MFAHLNHSRLLRYAGLFTWAVIGMPLLLLSLLPSDQAGGLDGDAVAVAHIGWQAWAAYAAFGLCYGWLTRALGSRRVGAFDYLLLLVLTASAVAISYYSASGLGSILLMVAACVLPWLLPLPLGVAWLVLSEFLVVPVYVRWLDMSWVEALMQSLLYAGFSGFVFVTSLVARQQAQAREDQRRLNAELRATRALLAESARINERTRISRELHDLLGHHLTALSLNLEVAGHLVQGKAQEHVSQAHTLARLLLSDVREAVSRLREGDAIDMSATLRPLADNVAGLQITMEMPQPFLLEDPERAHVLLRCTQEIITNAVRHAQAGELRLDYRYDGRMVRLHARDNGRGAEAPVAGNGLRGMRERLAAYGGRVDIDTRPGRGFAVDLRLPLEEGVAVPAPVPAMGPAEAAVALK